MPRGNFKGDEFKKLRSEIRRYELNIKRRLKNISSKGIDIESFHFKENTLDYRKVKSDEYKIIIREMKRRLAYLQNFNQRPTTYIIGQKRLNETLHPRGYQQEKQKAKGMDLNFKYKDGKTKGTRNTLKRDIPEPKDSEEPKIDEPEVEEPRVDEPEIPEPEIPEPKPMPYVPLPEPEEPDIPEEPGTPNIPPTNTPEVPKENPEDDEYEEDEEDIETSYQDKDALIRELMSKVYERFGNNPTGLVSKKRRKDLSKQILSIIEREVNNGTPPGEILDILIRALEDVINYDAELEEAYERHKDATFSGGRY